MHHTAFQCGAMELLLLLLVCFILYHEIKLCSVEVFFCVRMCCLSAYYVVCHAAMGE